MPLLDAATEHSRSIAHNEYSTITLAVAAICLIWYIAVAVVCVVGYVQLLRHYSLPPEPARSTPTQNVTIIRPIKGTEPHLYDCLASTFYQLYPKDRLHIRFCIPSRAETCLPVLKKLLQDFPNFDAEILAEDEDELLQHGSLQLGPNPKIRNMSRAYREARGDIVWIIDCNVWVGPQTCARMVETLERNKFVHLLPLVVDVTDTIASGRNTAVRNFGGGRLEEMFMSSSHAKFYTAINTVLIAPCIVGKSTMFRISHLNSLTHDQGIDFFSYNICEDHLIGDLLWKQKVPSEAGERGEKLGKHALCFGDLAMQPMSDMKLIEYWNRRVRWLRVRKFTVTLATLVEPGTESFLCSTYGAFAFTTLPIFSGYIPQTWSAFFAFWILSVSIWCTMDRRLFNFLHSGTSVRFDKNTPMFARPQGDIHNDTRRSFSEWLLAWFGRECLALPIWMWAFWGGTTVEWRGRKFWVGIDMRVHEIGCHAEISKEHSNGSYENGSGYGKRRD